MQTSMAGLRAGCLAVSLAVTQSGCGLAAPSCTDESGDVLSVAGQVAARGAATYTVVSPKHSNLHFRLTWPDAAATLALSATIIACGGHTGCQMITSTPAFGPGGSSPVPQPWPAGLREMSVDGTSGKTYRVEITSDAEQEAPFALQVTYRISCER
jgi:hypothetical protein